MKHRFFVSSILLLVAAAPLGASCGSSSCPLDIRAWALPSRGGFTVDLSMQYIDQDRPRIGTRDASVGEVHGAHHDEVRTLNKITTALVTYAPAERVHLTLGVPYVNREHNHLGSSHAHAEGRVLETNHNIVPQSWDISGLGDVTLEARAAIGGFNPVTQSGLWAIGGIKLPTGSHDRRNDLGQTGELPIQPGSGTTDGLVGVSYRGGWIRQTGLAGTAGNFAVVPWFVTGSYQFRTGDADGYRLGNEFQLSAGSAWPVTGSLDVLMQLNSRFRGKDSIADEPEEAAFTGGTFVYASPGLRFALPRGSAVYAVVQLPLYQDVNSLQLTSRANYVVGVQSRF